MYFGLNPLKSPRLFLLLDYRNICVSIILFLLNNYKLIIFIFILFIIYLFLFILFSYQAN